MVGYDGTTWKFPGSIDFITDTGTTAGTVTSKFHFKTGTDNTRVARLTVDKDGNIGIDEESPDAVFVIDKTDVFRCHSS